jgi:glyoxylase-like metal-dependent hydrolase (beta-lactamase superfamily II)
MEKQFGAVTFIAGENGARYPHCNSIYIRMAGLLIDPASNRDHSRHLAERDQVRTICLSHWHEDHYKDIDLFESADFWISEIDAVPFTDMDTYFEWYGLGTSEGESLRNTLKPVLIDQFHYQPRTPERLLKDGEKIDLGVLTMEVVHTPGHSPGHLAFLFVEPGILFLGDYTLEKFGPWYGDPHASLDDTIRSVQRLSKIPAELWICSHGKGIIENNPLQMWERYLNAIDQRDERLLGYLRNPRLMKEIVQQWLIIGKPDHVTDYERFGEQAHVKKHLTRLLQKKLISEESGRYFRVP